MTTGSAFIAAKGARSLSCQGRRRRRGVASWRVVVKLVVLHGFQADYLLSSQKNPRSSLTTAVIEERCRLSGNPACSKSKVGPPMLSLKTQLPVLGSVGPSALEKFVSPAVNVPSSRRLKQVVPSALSLTLSRWYSYLPITSCLEMGRSSQPVSRDSEIQLATDIQRLSGIATRPPGALGGGRWWGGGPFRVGRCRG